MSKPDDREVKVAFLQAQINVPEMGLLSQTMLGGDKTPGLKITINDHGLMLTKDKQVAFVPMTNVKVAVLK